MTSLTTETSNAVRYPKQRMDRTVMIIQSDKYEGSIKILL